jgi:carbamoyltransferase
LRRGVPQLRGQPPLLEETPSERLRQPGAGDSGGAIGAAAYVYHALYGKPRTHVMRDRGSAPLYGEEIVRLLNKPPDSVRAYGRRTGAVRFYGPQNQRGQIVGWLHGRMEFGPRALGARSILADPRRADMKDYLNERVKKRESFRPYAPAVLEERADEFFDLKNPSPFMLLSPASGPGFGKNPRRPHVDGTARVADKPSAAMCPPVLVAYRLRGPDGRPVLLNTSFNLRGRADRLFPGRGAGVFFERTEMDVLVLDKLRGGKTPRKKRARSIIPETAVPFFVFHPKRENL